jgi:hypothetical protein
MLKAAKIISASLAALMIIVIVCWRMEISVFSDSRDEDLGLLIFILQPVAAGFNFYIGRNTTGMWKRFAFVYTVLIVLMILGFAAMVLGAPIPDGFG